jgi:hypothetical protein
MSDDAGLIVKLGLSAVAIFAFIVPDPASSVTGLAALGAIWGLPLLDGGQE